MGAMLATSSRASSTGGASVTSGARRRRRRAGRRRPGGCPRAGRPPSGPPAPDGGRGRRCRWCRTSRRTARGRSRVGRWRRGPGRTGSRSASPTPSTRCRSAPARRWPRCRPAGCGPARWCVRAHRPGPAGPAGPDGDRPRSGGCACPHRPARRREAGVPAAPGPARSSASRCPVRDRPGGPMSPPRPTTGPWPVRPATWRTTAGATTAAVPTRRLASTDPVGSNSRHCPSADRAPTVASRTSGLVDVDTTGPLARQHVGNDQRRRLPRARRTEDHDRMFGR